MEILKPFRLKVAAEIIQGYRHDQAFHLYFASLCKQHKNWGSKDRKIYRSLCYQYFRLGHAAASGSVEEMILRAYEMQDDPGLYPAPAEIFPQQELLSHKVPFSEWALGHLKQRPLYLLLRKGAEEQVLRFLAASSVPYERIGTHTLRLPADSKCDDLITSGQALVMDLASQQAAEQIEIQEGDQVWDACSGAGGKSLYICNRYPFSFDLTCSDKRFSILENLKNRFRVCGFEMPRIELSDLTEAFQLSREFDRIILDVPCSGSGTWGRSPENLRSFDPSMAAYYSRLQRNIFSNAVSRLKAGGTLYYLTCSVFEAENEQNVSYFTAEYGLELQSEAYFGAASDESDTLYFARLQKPLLP